MIFNPRRGYSGRRFFTQLGILCVLLGGTLLSGCGKEAPAGTAQAGKPDSPVVRVRTGSPTQPQQPAETQQPADNRVVMVPPPTTAPAPIKPGIRLGPPATKPAVQPTPATTIQAPDNPKVATFLGLRAPKPATWIWHPSPSGMQDRIADYAVPGRDGSDQAHITVFKTGGSVGDNLTRWRKQFRSADGGPVEPKVQELQADEMPITLVEFAGEYRGANAISFTPDQLFLTAIVQAPAGQLFIRFVGPTGTVEPNREAFMDMIRGLKRVEPEK